MPRDSHDAPGAFDRPLLTNPGADRVRAVHALAGRAARRRAGCYLVEGPQAVREVVRWAPHLVRDMYLTPEAVDRYPEIVADARAAGLFLHLGDDAVLSAMSADAQGVLAVAVAPELQRGAQVGGASGFWGTSDASTVSDFANSSGASTSDTVSRSGASASNDPGTRDRATLLGPLGPEALDAVLATRSSLVAVLARVRDPGNAGTVVRVADAAGADVVLIAGESVEATNPKVVRSTAGSLFHLPVVSGLSVVDAVEAVRAAGLTVLAADRTGDLDLDDLQDAAARAGDGPVDGTDLRASTAWLFGNEAWGLPVEDRERADAVVRVPLRGRAESLNLGTAAAVCLYASSRAHR